MGGRAAISAHKAHLNFTPTEEGLAPFRKEREKHKTTKGMLQVAHTAPLSEALIRKIAEHRVLSVQWYGGRMRLEMARPMPCQPSADSDQRQCADHLQRCRQGRKT